MTTSAVSLSFEIPLTDVRITRRREREELGDIDSLAISIAKYGQLQPIVLDDNNELIAGERRYTAIQQNGSLTILAVRKQDVDEIMAKEMELEENLQRKQMTWQEQAKGLAELDRLRRVRDPNWTQVQTAIAAGGSTSQRDVSVAVNLLPMMEAFPEIAQAKSLSKAVKMAEQKKKNVARVLEVASTPEVYKDIEEKIWLGDSVERIKEVEDGRFAAIVTDPPFGVNYEDRTAGTSGTMSAYEDDEEKYLRILSMMPDFYRVLKPNGFLVFFMGISWYGDKLPEGMTGAATLREAASLLRSGKMNAADAAFLLEQLANERDKITFGVKSAMRLAGFTVDEIPIIWDRSEGRTFTSRPDRWFGRAYDIALHAIKGEPTLQKRGTHNILRVAPVPSSERDLLVERPVELYAELIERLTIPGEEVADFFVGSGSCPAAAALKGRRYFGCELDPERRAKAITKIKAHTPLGK